VIGALNGGENAPILGRDSNNVWWQIELGDSTEGWVYAQIVSTEGDTSGIAVAANIPTPPPPPTPSAPPTATSVPKPAVAYAVQSVRLWSVEENGGGHDGPSVHCGGGHQIFVHVLDNTGARLNGVKVKRIYSGEEFVTGAQGKGDGVAQFDMWSSGDQITITGDSSGPVTSETSRSVDVRDEAIPISDLIAAGYCTSEGDCQAKIDGNKLCRGHYSWDVVFQRTY
jgi:hypothetical protein